MRKRKPASPIKVALLDDRALVHEEYQRLLAQDRRLEVLDQTVTGASLSTEALSLSDVAVLDVSSSGVAGIDALQRILSTRPKARVLMLSMHRDAVYATRAFDAGASGYLTKPASPEQLVAAIHTVATGGRYVSPEVKEKLVRQPTRVHEVVTSLSKREHAILALLIQGIPIPEIGKRLGVSAKTVANQQTLIKAKLGADSALQLVLMARQLGM